MFYDDFSYEHDRQFRLHEKRMRELQLEQMKLREQQQRCDQNINLIMSGLQHSLDFSHVTTEYSSESAKQILYTKAKAIDLNKLGYLGTAVMDFYLSPILKKQLEAVMAVAIAKAMLQGLGTGVEASLCVREIMPEFDLLDGNDNIIRSNEWIQPTPLSTASIPRRGKDIVSVYRTDKTSKNDQKVILIYGLEFLNGLKNSIVDEVQFWRRSVKILSRIPITRGERLPMYQGFEKLDFIESYQDVGGNYLNHAFLSPHPHIYHNTMMILQQPILYGKNDLADIKFGYDLESAPSGPFDYIKFKGFVVEPLGLNVMG